MEFLMVCTLIPICDLPLITQRIGVFGDFLATRLGALFIANPDGQGVVVFSKVVMWG
jgi:hypothetical protein